MNERKICPFLKELDRILGHRPITTPSVELPITMISVPPVFTSYPSRNISFYRKRIAQSTNEICQSIVIEIDSFYDYHQNYHIHYLPNQKLASLSSSCTCLTPFVAFILQMAAFRLNIKASKWKSLMKAYIA